MMDVLRTILKSCVALLVIYAVWQVGPVYVTYVRLRTEIADATRQGGRGPEHELQAEVARIAAARGVSLGRDGIRVSKDRTHTRVRVTYTEELRPVPGLRYPWTVDIETEGLAVKPTTLGDVISEIQP